MESYLRDGFPGQRMRVLPRPQVREMLDDRTTGFLLVTDAGYFPEARRHGRDRRDSVSQAVVIFCVKGRGWCRTEAGTFEVAPGQAVVLPPDRPHAYGADPADPWTTWWLHAAGVAVPALLDDGAMTVAAPVRDVRDVYGTVALFEEVLGWMEQDTSRRSSVAASGVAWHLIAGLAAEDVRRGGTAEGVDRAIEHLRMHFRSAISVGQLASIAGLSASHFAALFKARVGQSVRTYQTELRMAAARELLDVTERSVESIAASVGYEDAFYFSRQFRHVHGQSPTSYRQHDKG